MMTRKKALVLVALSSCSPAPPPNHAEPPPPPVATAPLPAPAASSPGIVGEKRPLTSLPYTPSLDVPSLDRSADPCVDFYQFTCGGWMKNNPLPADQASWSVYGKLAAENEQFLWGILEDAAKPVPSRDPVAQKIGDYFAACSDTAATEKAGLTPIQSTLDEIAALKSVADLPALLGRHHLRLPLGATASPLFSFTSAQDFDDANKVIAFAGAGGLGLPDRDYYTKTDPKSVEAREKYLLHVQAMLELTGEPEAEAKAHALVVMSIETELARASLTNVEKRDPRKLSHKMPLKKLEAITPSFAWSGYLSVLGADARELNVTEPKFYAALDTQLKTRDVAALRTYLRWHTVHAYAPYLSSKIVDTDFAFYRKYLRGVTEQQPRWKRCVQWVDRDLGEALGQEFVRRTFSTATKQTTVKMTEAVEKAMEDDLASLTWMGPETKKQAMAKLKTIRNKIGFPEKWRDYGPLSIARGDFFGNVSRSFEFEYRRQLGKIGKPLDRGEWGMTPPTVNAYYDAQMNDINFPAAVLQPPLYDPKMDDAPNYGNTGATIGHELTHGFDDEGRQFNAKGNLRDWWTKKDAAEFEKRAGCVKAQYAEYVAVDEVHINSALTLGEDVADLGGTLLAYVAWKTVTKGMNLPKADGFTPDQRFFVGMAQWACNNERPENLRLHAATDPHSPGKYRINGVVANLPEFAKAFECKAGQPMVRANVCRVW